MKKLFTNGTLKMCVLSVVSYYLGAGTTIGHRTIKLGSKASNTDRTTTKTTAINVRQQHPRRRNVNAIRQPGDPAPSDQEVRIAAEQRIPTHASTTLGPKVHPHKHTHSHPRVCIPMHQSHQPQRILSGFLESEGLNPAFDSRLLLIRAGDVEENPGPKVSPNRR